ncbi:MAG: beta-lactamase family protein [Pyrinomonadaceae bacterium]|nr:beta-lactamase family protein [Pyrinomonadaceae bacterium]
MQRMAHLRIALFLLLHTPVYLAAQNQSTLTPDKVTKIEDLIRAEMSVSKIPGLSIAVVSDNQLRYANGFGLADLENSTLAKLVTVYRLGSLSKTITATAVMQLAEKSKLDLDAPIQKYCPAFPVKPWQITARHLLAHQGGVRDYSNQKFLEEYFSTRHYNSITESLDIFKNDPLLQEPGTKFSYSSYGYNLLGCAVEGASETAYEDYIRQNILKPANMGHTGVDDIFQIIANRARGYGKTRDGVMRNTGLADTSNKVPAGGLVSTVEDISKFFLGLQNGTLVSKATVERMWTLQKTLDGKQTPYGLGWRVSDRNGTKEVYHGGAAAGFSTFLYIRPEKKVAVVLMANMELLGQKQRDDLARQIADIVIG